MLMSSQHYRESLRARAPRVFVDGRRVESVADDPALAPGVNAIGVTYDYALDPRHASLALAPASRGDGRVNRFLAINRSTDDLMAKLEYTRLVCQETGCAMRYLTMDGFNAVHQATHRVDADLGTEYHARFLDYLEHAEADDLTVAIAMTDAKGDRSLRPHQQPNPDTHVRVVERRADGIVISGTKAIVTSAPYVHELLVLPGRAMTAADADFALACAVPVDAPGLTIVARRAGRPGEPRAVFSGRYGQSTGLCRFDRVLVPWDRVFLCGEWQHAEYLTKAYATHHRHTCIAARAGFGDLLIGAGALMIEANGLSADRHGHLRDTMVELIKVVEGFYACGVAASVFGTRQESGAVEPDAVYSNVGKLLLATQIYDMHRLAHTVSGGLVVTLPGPEEDHNPETAADLAAVLQARPDIPYARRASIARLVEDVTATDAGGWMSVISLHGGGSPEAMRREIWRRYPVPERKALVERLIERGVATGAEPSSAREPGQCCDTGCSPGPAAPSTRPGGR
ncbi:MAG: 4-hydroxyphenylacetate 3-hydroxylase [Ectothiorhodospiraceae bacterium]|nr:4-hydroxyphenylacetate 3-hydroxylase [Chromatiales bacterium]MCP5156333.1 4-hydroxyphenylacetate 3-hydroxylase [Ectothiorhodospiraceae bacterium]